MKQIIAGFLLIFLLLSPGPLKAEQDANLSASTPSQSESPIEKPASPVLYGEVEAFRQFTYVAPEEIPLDFMATREDSESTKGELNRKIRSEYIPIRLSIFNKTGKMVQIPHQNIYFLNSKGEKQSLPTQNEIFQNVKRHGVRRALAWGLPLGIATFGIFLIPTFIFSGTHTAVTNGTIKSNLEQNFYEGGYLSPEGGVTTFLFVPKRKSNVTQIVFERVINTEDGVETQQIINIRNLGEKNAD